jgi:pSer/pThr/pTyr-binding forkhead associated (FHA) protein
MSELALTLLRFGFLIILWMVIFLVLNLMRSDLQKSTRRRNVQPSNLNVAFPSNATRKSKLNRVVVQQADGKSDSFPLMNAMRIGRADSNQIQISDEFASNVHAEITHDEAGWLYTDLGSTNGSWLDRKRISEPIRLKQNMVIRINETKLRFEK